jgi:hypothetical protein
MRGEDRHQSRPRPSFSRRVRLRKARFCLLPSHISSLLRAVPPVWRHLEISRIPLSSLVVKELSSLCGDTLYPPSLPQTFGKSQGHTTEKTTHTTTTHPPLQPAQPSKILPKLPLKTRYIPRPIRSSVHTPLWYTDHLYQHTSITQPRFLSFIRRISILILILLPILWTIERG